MKFPPASRRLNGLLSITIVAVMMSHIVGQDRLAELKLFEKGGISFSFPRTFNLTQKNDNDKETFVLNQETSSAIIAITVYHSVVSSYDQFNSLHRTFTTPYIDTLVKAFSSSRVSTSQEPSCTNVRAFGKLPGVTLRGMYQNENTTAEVYDFVRGGYFVALVYLRANNDSAPDSAWEAVRQTLTVSSQHNSSSFDSGFSGEVLNGKAVRLVQPNYPLMARTAHVSGAVGVQVTIDESGKVISAQAVSGHPLLKNAAVEAARDSKFPPTLLCGEPVSVNGFIIYNFVPR
jgi:TonB family protein